MSSLDDLAVHIRQVRESAPPLFSTIIGSIFVEDWTRVMSLNLNVLSVPKSLKVRITCLFMRGEPTAWFEHVAQPRMYQWNKFRSSLERNFGSFGADSKSRMVKEFGNNTEDSSKGGLGHCEGSSEGGLGHCEGAGPSSAPSRDIGDSGSDSSDPEDDFEEDLKEDTDGTETLSWV